MTVPVRPRHSSIAREWERQQSQKGRRTVFLKRQFRFTADHELHGKLVDKCGELDVTVAHFVRCALVPDTGDVLERGDRLDTGDIPSPRGIHPNNCDDMHVIGLRVTQAEHEVIARWAIHEGMSMAELARTAIGDLIGSPSVAETVERSERTLDLRCRLLLKEIGTR